MFVDYVKKSQNIFIDLVLNEEMVEDVDVICKAMEKYKGDEKRNVIIISSYMSWMETDCLEYFKENHKGGYRWYVK